VTPKGSARAEEVVETLGLRDLLDNGAILIRTDVELALPSVSVVSIVGSVREPGEAEL
jgi:hypothetical protein